MNFDLFVMSYQIKDKYNVSFICHI